MTKKIQKKTSGKHAKIHSTTPGELSMMISNADQTNFAVITSGGFDLWLYDQTDIKIQFKISGNTDELKLTFNNQSVVDMSGGWSLVSEPITYDFEYTSPDNLYWIGFDLSANLPGDIGGGIAMVGTVSMIVPR